MKSLFLKTLVSAVALSPAAFALSLYDTAPEVGLPVSEAAKYFVSLRSGYDTNPEGSTTKIGKVGSAYVGASLNTSFADVESIDKLKYSVNLGGTRYLKSTRGQKYRCNSSANVSMQHAFSAGSRYVGNFHVSYTPEPEYDNGISSASLRGDTLTWGVGNTYSQSIDERWSWHISARLSGTKYEHSYNSYDDRQYYSVSAGLNYRSSDLMTYTASCTYRDELRSYGMNSQSIFGSIGVQYALDPVSSMSLSGGVQGKMMAHRNTMNPTLDWGYRRRVSDGLSMNVYVKYSDENVDNYSKNMNASYRSSGTWRAGAYGTYALSPDVSYIFRVQVMETKYTKATDAKMSDASRWSLNPSLSMNYNFTPSVQGTLSAEYTYYHYERGKSTNMYSRWNFSAGLNYRF